MGFSSSKPVHHLPIRIDLQNDLEAEAKGPHDLQYCEDQAGDWDVLKPDLIRSLMGDNTIDQIVVYVHGHNNTREEAYTKLKNMIPQITKGFGDKAEDIHKRIRYLCLTWDAHCNKGHSKQPLRTLFQPIELLCYLDDLDKITYASEGLNHLLNRLGQSGKKLHLIGHSIGCQAIITYLTQVALCHSVLTRPFFNGSPERGTVSRQILRNIRTVVMLAPDVPTHRIRSFFHQWYPVFWNGGGLRRFAFISSNWDLALWGSEMLRMGSDRAGIPKNIRRCLNGMGEIKLKDWECCDKKTTEGGTTKSPDRDYDASPIKVCNTRAFRAFGHGVYANPKSNFAIGCLIRQTIEADSACLASPNTGQWATTESGAPDTAIKRQRLPFQCMVLKRK